MNCCEKEQVFCVMKSTTIMINNLVRLKVSYVLEIPNTSTIIVFFLDYNESVLISYHVLIEGAEFCQIFALKKGELLFSFTLNSSRSVSQIKYILYSIGI